jgi:prepilin-type N-terminal cleavage/methylation domain-containing protein
MIEDDNWQINEQIISGGPPRGECGFSLIELIVSLLITLIILGVAVATFTSALTSRQFQADRTDGITSAQAALNIMSREIGNSGYGLIHNGLVVADSGDNRIHFRSNIHNTNQVTDDEGEDITYFFDPNSQSVVRYDPAANPTTSGIINSVSDIDFHYYNFGTACNQTTSPGGCLGTASTDTGKVRITLTVVLDRNANVNANGNRQNVEISSEVTLRNSPTIKGKY